MYAIFAVTLGHCPGNSIVVIDNVLLQEEQHHLKQQLAELAIQINMDTLKARQIEVDDRKQQQMMKEKELEVCHYSYYPYSLWLSLSLTVYYVLHVISPMG